jgi:hypothetical protein
LLGEEGERAVVRGVGEREKKKRNSIAESFTHRGSAGR